MAVATLPGFDDGVVSIQDASAQLVADALAPARGARVLDACVAPGGKAAHLLERDASLQLTAIDIDPQRLQRVRGNLRRLGLQDAARLVAADAADTAAWWDGVPFDAVLLDAPCSATGIVRRQPDVLLHRRASDLDALGATQARLVMLIAITFAVVGGLVWGRLVDRYGPKRSLTLVLYLWMATFTLAPSMRTARARASGSFESDHASGCIRCDASSAARIDFRRFSIARKHET